MLKPPVKAAMLGGGPAVSAPIVTVSMFDCSCQAAMAPTDPPATSTTASAPPMRPSTLLHAVERLRRPWRAMDSGAAVRRVELARESLTGGTSFREDGMRK